MSYRQPIEYMPTSRLEHVLRVGIESDAAQRAAPISGGGPTPKPHPYEKEWTPYLERFERAVKVWEDAKQAKKPPAEIKRLKALAEKAMREMDAKEAELKKRDAAHREAMKGMSEKERKQYMKDLANVRKGKMI